jgi:hypothetical protein
VISLLMFSRGRATDFSPRTPCLTTRRRGASGTAARGTSRKSCKRVCTGRRLGTKRSRGAGDAVTTFSAFSPSSCPPRPPGRKPPAAGLCGSSAAKVLTPGISISEARSRVRNNSNPYGLGRKPRSCVSPPEDKRGQGGREERSIALLVLSLRSFYRSAYAGLVLTFPLRRTRSRCRGQGPGIDLLSPPDLSPAP